jgi:hypothetical protein
MLVGRGLAGARHPVVGSVLSGLPGKSRQNPRILNEGPDWLEADRSPGLQVQGANFQTLPDFIW